MTENSDGRADVHWSPRVPKWKLRRLYQLEAQGIYDDALLDDIGWTLYLRCRDILTIHDALNGTVRCPRCAQARQVSFIPRQTHAREEELRCPVCDWHLTWYEYHLTFKREQLNPGGAVEAFAAFMRDFDAAHTPQAKMLAIDRVIHAFHYALRVQPDLPTRPAGVNLIVGKLTDVVRFLDELSGIENSPTIQQTDAAWRANFVASWWPEFLERAGVTIEQEGESANESAHDSPKSGIQHPASDLVAVCVRTRSNEINDLIAAECEHLTGGRPDLEGVAVCRAVDQIHRAAYVRTGLRRIAQAATFAGLLDVLRQTRLDLEDFRVDALYLSGRFPMSQQEAVVAAADAIRCRANVAAPRHRLLLVAQRATFWIGEILAEATQSYTPHLKKPCHVSISLEARIARALVNLVVPPAGTLIDPCCGTGSILLEAAALGMTAYGADRNPKMAHMAQRNLLHFGYPPRVVCADARTWSQTADALVTDVPYGRQLESAEDDLPAILDHGARLASLAVYVAGNDITSQLAAAGYGDVEVLRLIKPNGFTRYVHRARLAEGGLVCLPSLS